MLYFFKILKQLGFKNLGEIFFYQKKHKYKPLKTTQILKLQKSYYNKSSTSF